MEKNSPAGGLVGLRALYMLVVALALAGCVGGISSPPTAFYTLDAAHVPMARPTSPAGRGIAVGLGPLVLPDMLSRPQIVSRAGDHGILLADYHHWAGDLNANAMGLMARRLMQRLGSQRVFLHPWPRFRQPDYQVRIDALRFDGELGGEVVLNGTWTLLDGQGGKEIRVESVGLREPLPGGGYPGMVAALSRLLVSLTDRIAEGILRQSQEGG